MTLRIVLKALWRLTKLVLAFAMISITVNAIDLLTGSKIGTWSVGIIALVVLFGMYLTDARDEEKEHSEGIIKWRF